MDVILSTETPFKVNGFHPALVLHFTEYVKIKNENIDKI
jgi:hypothetical protein